MEKLSQGGEIHNFEQDNEFVGVYTGDTLKWEKDNLEQGKKIGDVIGHEFHPRDSDETVVIGNSYAVNKAMAKISKGDIVSFRHLGKTEMKGGKSVNRMEIIKWDNWKEFDLLAEEKISRQSEKDRNPQM
jgi:hypothetical protein